MPSTKSMFQISPQTLAKVQIVWGSTFLGIRVAVETIPPFLMAAVRFVISGGVLLAISYRSLSTVTLRQWGSACLSGSLYFLGNHGFVNTASRHMPSGLISIINATEVPMIAVLSSLLLPNQALNRRTLLGIVLGISGVAWLFMNQGLVPGENILWPSLCVLGAAICWSLGAVISQRLDLPSDSLLKAGLQMMCGGLLLTIGARVRGEMTNFHVSAFSARSILALAFLILFGSVLAFACFTWLLKRVRTEAVATHVFVNPFVAVGLGAWLANEKVQSSYLIAGALILLSVYVIIFLKPQPTAAPNSLEDFSGAVAE
jgi:drug/metabolite transporter (DMT)-like permease